MNNADAQLATCYGPVSQAFLDRAAKIRLLILDVDVYYPTDLSIWVTRRGAESVQRPRWLWYPLRADLRHRSGDY